MDEQWRSTKLGRTCDRGVTKGHRYVTCDHVHCTPGTRKRLIPPLARTMKYVLLPPASLSPRESYTNNGGDSTYTSKPWGQCSDCNRYSNLTGQ